MLFLLLFLLGPLLGIHAMEFTPYKASEHYKCGAFLQNRVEDKTLNYYYSSINNLLKLLSNPFPHEELLNRQAIMGDVNELRLSIETKYADWWTWQKGFLLAAGAIVLLGAALPMLFVLYRCCICCFSKSKKRENTDKRFDGCKRIILNTIFAILVLLDVFAAATLLITSQYAEHGLDELPNRLNYCIDDLNLYKRDTDARIRKLLIDDYQMLNRTVSSQLSQAGHEVVEKVKKITGASTIDVLMNISKNAQDVHDSLKDMRVEVNQILANYSTYEVEYGRMRQTVSDELQECLQNEVESLKAMCHKAVKTLDLMTPPRLDFDIDVLSTSADKFLGQIIDANIPRLLDSAVQRFADMQSKLQSEINKKVHSSQEILKRIADDLFVAAETISSRIHQIDFDFLYDYVAHASDPKDSISVKIVHYSRILSLVITSIFMLLACCFLLGLFYGICGRRPTFYNDDCCVRSTGARFYSCGIWMTIMTFTALSMLTGILLFSVGNASELLCRTLRDPLSRPDMISLGERYLEIIRSKEQSSDGLMSLMHNHSLVDVIRACQRNETLYEVFELDKKYQLMDLKIHEKDTYNKLERFLNDTLSSLPEIGPIDNFISKEKLEALQQLENRNVNVSGIANKVLEKINSSISNMDVQAKANVFESRIDQRAGRPKAITSMLEQIQEIDSRIAKPLRLKLEQLLENLTDLNKRFDQLRVPVNSLLSKLQHAQALISEDLTGNLKKAAREQLNVMFANVNKYIDHVKYQMQHDVSSCAPIRLIISSSSAAVCDHTIDPLNGSWMSMLISLVCLVPMILFATTLVTLYNKMHAYPKYVVETPPDHHQMSSFITDTYETRHKPGYTNYSYMDNYHRTFR